MIRPQEAHQGDGRSDQQYKELHVGDGLKLTDAHESGIRSVDMRPIDINARARDWLRSERGRGGQDPEGLFGRQQHLTILPWFVGAADRGKRDWSQGWNRADDKPGSQIGLVDVPNDPPRRALLLPAGREEDGGV